MMPYEQSWYTHAVKDFGLTWQAVGLDDVGDEQDGSEDEGDAPGGDVERALTLLEPIFFQFPLRKNNAIPLLW